MLSLLLISVALCANTTLHIGVATSAGGLHDVAADGADGLCHMAPSSVTCPAEGPVTFRWGGDPIYELVGDSVVSPSETGIAWILAKGDTRTEELARLQPDVVTAEAVFDLFTRTGEQIPDVPSWEMLEALFSLSNHPNPKVRQAMVQGLIPWVWTSSLGPMMPSSPVIVPDGLLTTLANDPDKGVRKRVAILIRELRDSHLSDEAVVVLEQLQTDNGYWVQRSANRAWSAAAANDLLPANEAWERALVGVEAKDSAGRAAVTSLAWLRKTINPATVDAHAAVEKVLRYHPQSAWKIWAAWRLEVPFHRPWVDQLLTETPGLAPRLFRHWADEAPDELAAAITLWEPSGPNTEHTERFKMAQRLLEEVDHKALREALDL